MTIYSMANSTIQATYMTSGQYVGQVRFIINIGVGDPLNWGGYVYSKQNHGLGSGGSDPNYPYFVEKFNGSNNATVYKTYSQGNYVVILALQGIGEVDYSYFDVGVVGGELGLISIPSSISLNVGETKTITATCQDTYGNNMTCPTLTFSSEGGYITFDAITYNSVTIRGVKAGQTKLDVKDPVRGIANYSNVTVTGGGGILNQISIPSTKSVIKNNSAIITATCKDTNGAGMTCPTLTWAKSNNNVDIVPWDNNIDCTIIGVNVGTCIVVASGGGKLSNNCTVTITESTGTLNQIIITSSISIVKGNTGSVSYSCKDTLGNNMTCPTLTWTSSNTSVATVSNGMITGVNAGTCVVKAAGGGKTSNDCNVTITSITPPPTNNYGCYNGQCLQGYGTLPPGCNNTCTTPTPTKYNCVSGQCQGPYTEGTFDSYADCVASGCGGVVNNYGCFGNQCLQGYGNLPPGCNNTCGGGEIDPCISCDKETQYCLFGQCVKKNDAYMAAGAVVLLMLLTKK